MALLERFISPADVQIGVAPTHLRRCTFRRVTIVQQKGALPLYEAACMFPDRTTPLPLGDLATAKSACESCTAQGIFRPDSD